VGKSKKVDFDCYYTREGQKGVLDVTYHEEKLWDTIMKILNEESGRYVHHIVTEKIAPEIKNGIITHNCYVTIYFELQGI
jgi:hypothetical protein